MKTFIASSLLIQAARLQAGASLNNPNAVRRVFGFAYHCGASAYHYDVGAEYGADHCGVDEEQEAKFRAFQKTGRDVANVFAAVTDYGGGPVDGEIQPGRVYVDALVIESYDNGQKWLAMLFGRDASSGDLETVERALFGFAVEEQYV